MQRAAAIAGSLLLLYFSSTAMAASVKPSAGPVASKPAKVANKAPGKSGRGTARPKPRPASRAGPASAEIGLADLIDSDTVGLHGSASFYGHGFQGRKTATGEYFDVRQFTAASNHFPLGSRVAVRRLDSDRCAIVKINDRMHAKHRRRVIDVSRGVAEYLDMLRAGVVLVRVVPFSGAGDERGMSACLAAFDPETACHDCPLPMRLPGADD